MHSQKNILPYFCRVTKAVYRLAQRRIMESQFGSSRPIATSKKKTLQRLFIDIFFGSFLRAKMGLFLFCLWIYERKATFPPCDAFLGRVKLKIQYFSLLVEYLWCSWHPNPRGKLFCWTTACNLGQIMASMVHLGAITNIRSPCRAKRSLKALGSVQIQLTETLWAILFEILPFSVLLFFLENCQKTYQPVYEKHHSAKKKLKGSVEFNFFYQSDYIAITRSASLSYLPFLG